MSRLRANGNVQAQFGAALRGKFDLGARARGGLAGLCKKEAPAMDPLKCVLTKCTPVARTPGAPVRPRGSAHINFDDHLGNEPDPGYGARRKLHAPLISLENHVCAKTPLLPPRVLPRDLRYCPQDRGCGHVPNALRANRAYATRLGQMHRTK